MKTFNEMKQILEAAYDRDVAKKIQDYLFGIYRLIAEVYQAHHYYNKLSPEQRKSLEDHEEINSHVNWHLSGGLPGDYINKELLTKFGAEKMSSAAKAKEISGRFTRSPWGANPVDLEDAIPNVIAKVQYYLKSVKDELFLLKHTEADLYKSLELVSDPNRIQEMLKQEKFDDLLEDIKVAEKDIIRYGGGSSAGLYPKITSALESDPSRWTSGRV
jgi:hypothetical protein